MPVTIIPSSPTPNSLPRRRIACLPCGHGSSAGRACHAWVVGRDLPEIGPASLQGPPRAARLELVAQEQDQIGTHGRVAIEVGMANKAGGHAGIDDLRARHPVEMLALRVCQVLRAHLAN